MPRPCTAQHPPSPATCPFCAWCSLPGDDAKRYRQEWGEAEPPKHQFAVKVNGKPHVAPGDLFPGIPDPMSSTWPSPLPDSWAFADHVRLEHIAALRELLSRDLVAPDRPGGDGIILVGGGRYWPMIVISCRMARMFTKIPIQVWHSGDSEPVNPADVAGLADVTIRDVTKLGFPLHRIGGWENKTTAILNSGFSRIFYLDADAYLVADPTPVLDAASQSRFAFWADLPWNDETVDWNWCGVDNSARVAPVQGGQLAIDVISFWKELIVSHFINQHSPYFYRHQYGDQDSWRIALAATGGHHHVLGAAGWQPPAFVCRYPEPFVVHRCQAKLWGDEQVVFAHDLPWEGKVREFYNEHVIGRGEAAEVFGRIYKVGMWGAAGSSGAGASDHEATPWIDIISTMSRLAGWCNVVDLGCGDGRVTMRLPHQRITAVDVHEPHLSKLKQDCPKITWIVADLDRDRNELPSGQVAFFKDVLHHWPSALIRDWIEWARTCGKWGHVVFCQDCHQAEDGADCILGGYRALNPSMMPLRGLPLIPVMQFLHKQVLHMICEFDGEGRRVRV